MTESVIESLESFGLSSYEARVLVSLYKLGRGDAKEIHTESGIPRSQVYGAADSLTEIGLVEMVQKHPKQYRPTGVDVLEEHIEQFVETHTDRVFDYLDSLAESENEDASIEQGLWTITGEILIRNRIQALTNGCQSELVVVLGSINDLSEELLDLLEATSSRGVNVELVSVDSQLPTQIETDFLNIRTVSEHWSELDIIGILLIADQRKMLLRHTHTDETAIWSNDQMYSSTIQTLILNATVSP
jgi:sugar-specific transcriptional regulator TrmB